MSKYPFKKYLLIITLQNVKYQKIKTVKFELIVN